MARINVLPKHIAELIAAGEVVERPASVVKELMENSVDAGATSITVEIKNGGITYIRITDNGCGIDHEDVPKAFISHATSKVKTETDLNAIFTLGFRGEALASIAAVSRTEVLTKTPEESLGTTYAIEGGRESRYDKAGCPDGTTIIVRDLFYNTPARMKFLKRDVSEANAVADIVDRIALSHPEISIRFIREGRQALITPGDGKLLSAIYSVFGRSFAESLVEVNYELEGVKVEGFVCKPASSRPSRSMQYFFLNKRFIKSRSCMASMENAYKNSIMVGKFPSCVLNISVRPEVVDVNVHPAKTEVRFSDERKVTSAVYFAVKSAIETIEAPVTVDSSRLQKVVAKATPDAVQLQMAETQALSAQAQQQPQVQQATPSVSQSVKPEPRDDFWQVMPAERFGETILREETVFSNPPPNSDEPDLISAFKKKNSSFSEDVFEKPIPTVEETASEVPALAPEVIITEEKALPPKLLRLIGEAFKTYIICEYDGKVILIDKHAAHERIIYNKMKKNASENISSQVLLSPVTVTLGKNEYNTVTENLDVFKKAGYLVEDFGTGVVIVRECPMLISGDDIEDTVVEIASYLCDNKADVESEKIDNIHHTAACKAAIKAGYKNSTAEMKVLAEQVLYDNSVRYCPHGRPILIELSKYELEKLFGRIQ